MNRVLLVDDEPLVLGMQVELLRRADHDWEIVSASDGRLALSALEKAPFDIVVSDMRMPNMDGAELLAVVRDRWPGTVRILQSGFCSEDASQRAVSVAHQFFPKPVPGAVFRDALLGVCALRTSLRNPKLLELIGDTTALPGAPRLYLELMRCLSEDHATVEDVASIIEQDPGMCAKTLQLVRSAYFGLSRDTTSIQEAVAILGFNLVKSLVLVVGVFDIDWPAKKVTRFSLDIEQRHALRVAGASKVISAGTSLVESALIAGMLHDVGKLVLASSWPEEYEKVLEIAEAEERPLFRVEEQELGVSHTDVGAYLLGIWGMPKLVVEAVARHHLPEGNEAHTLDVAGVVHIADALARGCIPPPDPPDDRQCLLDAEYIDSLGLSKQVIAWGEAFDNGG